MYLVSSWLELLSDEKKIIVNYWRENAEKKNRHMYRSKLQRSADSRHFDAN